AREERDRQAAKLRDLYAPKVATLQERLRRAEQAVEREKEQAQQSKLSTMVSFGTTVLGAILGRKKISATTIGKAATTARGAAKSMKDSGDVARAEETVQAMQQQLADLESKFQAELAELNNKVDPQTEKLETVTVKPKKTNINVKLLALAWAPFW